MNFDEFIKSGTVRKGTPDVQHSKALVKMSEMHVRFLSGQVIDEVSSSTVFVMFYEALREIIEAVAAKEGYKVYSHEAYTAYLKLLGDSEIAVKFDRFRKIRNAANYYGKMVDVAETRASAEEIMMLIDKIKNKYLQNI